MQLDKNIDKYQVTLDEIVRSYGCRLDQGYERPGMMYVEFGYLEGPEVIPGPTAMYPNAQSRFFVNLHELGHFYHGHTQGRPRQNYEDKIVERYDPETWNDYSFYFDNGVLNSEAEAWNYAIDNCGLSDEEIFPETREYVWNKCLNSYLSHAQRVGFETPGQFLYNGDRAYVPFAYGTPDDYFRSTKKRILVGDNEPEDEG